LAHRIHSAFPCFEQSQRHLPAARAQALARHLSAITCKPWPGDLRKALAGSRGKLLLELIETLGSKAVSVKVWVLTWMAGVSCRDMRLTVKRGVSCMQIKLHCGLPCKRVLLYNVPSEGRPS
jgi:hypothetical protein